MKKKIGCNYSNGIYYGGCLSSFNGTFTNEEVMIENGIGDIVTAKIGDITDAYEILKRKIMENNKNNFYDICHLIYVTIDEYFNGIENISKRIEYYTPEDEEGHENNKISNLKGSGAAMCVERSMLAQNLLKSLNINSYYKCSGIIKNESKEIHSYNLIEYNNNYYIFDSSIPTIKNGVITPLITNIPKEVFNKIISPEQSIGYSIKVSHYNPLRDTDVTITYDSGRKDLYEIDNSKIITK